MACRPDGIDSSALVAIVTGEPERRAFIEAIIAADTRLVAAPTLLETSLVLLSRAGEGRLQDLRDFCSRGTVEAVPFGPEHVELALDAFRRFGKGRHPAGLNFGDCFPTRSPKPPANRCCSRARILPARMSGRLCDAEVALFGGWRRQAG